MTEYGSNYTIRHGTRHDTCRIRVWDSLEKKQVYRSVVIPPELKGKKIEAFCIKQVEEFQAQVSYRTSVAPSKTTFGDYFCGEWSEYKIAQGKDLTLKGYRNIYDVHLSDCLGPIPLDKITPRLLSNIYKEKAESGVSKDRVHRLHMLIGQVLGDAKKNGIIKENVARDNMDGPAKERETAQYDRVVLTDSDVQTIFDAVCKMEPYWQTLFLVTMIRGLRREEIAALRWETILKHGYDLKIISAIRISHGEKLRVKQPKSASSRRSMPSTDLLKTILEEWRMVCGNPTEGYVFPSSVNPGEPVYPDTISRHATKLSRKLGIQFTFHTLRHVYISKMITSAHADPRTAQTLAGHSDIRVTMGIYAESDREKLRKAEASFESQFVLNRTIKTVELNEADVGFSLVSYVETHGKTSTKLVQINQDNSVKP